MARIKYVDFDIRIENAGDFYRVYVLNSLAGEAKAQFTYPSLDTELKRIINHLGHTRRGVRAVESRESQTAQEFGAKLFNTVFTGDIRSRFDSAKATLTENNGLRLRLNLSNAPELADIPWEFLFDPSDDRFLTLSVETPLVRYLDLSRPITPLEIAPPLEVLVMISSPSNVMQLDVEHEWEKLKDALADLEERKLVKLTRMDNATLPALRNQLRKGRYNILHFIGHGGFDSVAKDGFLLFESETGRSQEVSGQVLGTLLYDSRYSLRLAVLNACEGARADTTDPFAGTAQSLVQKGIPAVIAMQFEISDRAAIIMAHEFYAALADGFPVDAALTQSRQAIYAQSSETGNSVEWGTPVIYMRSPDGQIFSIPESTTASEVATPPPYVPDDDLARRLDKLYSDGLEASVLGDWNKADRSFQSIVELRPDFLDAASRLEEARRQNALQALYTRARSVYDAGEWQEAVSALTELVAKAPDYQDASGLLEAARKQNQLSNSYSQARLLSKSAKWQAVAKIMDQIRALDPTYPDPDGLFAKAADENAQMLRSGMLEDLYKSALQAQAAMRWQDSIQPLKQIREIQVGYRETERLLELADKKVAGDLQQQRMKQVSDAYAQANKLFQDGQWQQALDKMNEISSLDPKFEDPHNIAARARTAIKTDKQLAEQKERLANMYSDALRLFKEEQYPSVLEKWAEIQAIDPGYPDSQKIAAKAQKENEEQNQEARKQARLAKMYAEAEDLFIAGSFLKSKEKLDEIRSIRPDYPDPQNLLGKIAQKKIIAAPSKGNPISTRAFVIIGIIALVIICLMVIFAYYGKGI